MSEEKKYLSIKEFAAAAGVSNKAIYQQLSGRLKEYCKVEHGVKMLDSEALQVFYADNIQDLNQVSSQVESSLESQENNEVTALKMLIDELKQDKEDLKKDKEQLIKDKEDLKQEALKWQQLLADERNKVKLLEAAAKPVEEVNFTEVKEVEEEPAAAAEPEELPHTFKEKIKWLFNNK